MKISARAVSIIAAVVAGCSTSIATAQTASNPHKFFTPRSAVLFSPRWAETGELTTSQYMDVADDYGASSIVWHYPISFGTDNGNLVQASISRGHGLRSCALPVHTASPAAACRDGNGNPIPHHAATNRYYPDTNTQAWRDEVSNAVQFAKTAGCNALHQDDAFFMVTRMQNGCYASKPRAEVEDDVFEYYDWLTSRIRTEFGGSIPLTYNKVSQGEDEASHGMNDLAPYFNGVMGEVHEDQNYPYALFHSTWNVNNLLLNQRTVSTLVSTSPLRNERHIATTYAIGNHPIVPFDVYIAPGERYFGPVSIYEPYYSLVSSNPTLFDGYGIIDAYIDHHQNPSGVYRYADGLEGVYGRSNMMSTLSGNSAGGRVLHIVNWQDSVRYFTMWINKSHIPFTPTRAVVRRPGAGAYEISVASDGNRWKLTVHSVDVWAVAELLP